MTNSECLYRKLGEALFYIMERSDPVWLGDTGDDGKPIRDYNDIPDEAKEGFTELAENFIKRNSEDILAVLSESR